MSAREGRSLGEERSMDVSILNTANTNYAGLRNICLTETSLLELRRSIDAKTPNLTNYVGVRNITLTRASTLGLHILLK